MHVLDLFNDKERKFLNGGPLEEADGKQRMSRAAKGNEKYGKDGMKALAKAGREGASEEKLDKIRDKHNKYDESVEEAAKKGLYYNVNKRKAAGTSRDADSPKAPTAQAWKDAAKTAKKESVAEVAGAQKCWPGHRKVGTQPGTGRNAGKRVNDCEKIKKEDTPNPTPRMVDKDGNPVPHGTRGQTMPRSTVTRELQPGDAYSTSKGVVTKTPTGIVHNKRSDLTPKPNFVEGMLDNPGKPDSPVAQAIVHRITTQRTDLLAKHGPEKVSQAVDEVADFVGDVDEIGSSDVSGWVRHVEQMLGNMDQGVAEGSLEEISQDTARSYAQKATQSKKDLINQTYRKGADTDKLNKKIQTRQQGLNRAHTDNRYYKDEQGVAEGSEELYGLKVGDTVKATVRGVKVQGDVVDIFPETEQVELLLRGANAGKTVTVDVRDTESMNEQGVAEATGDKPFDDMMKTIKKGTAKQATADRREQRKQSQQQARDAFGPNPAANLGIRKPPVSEGDTEQKPRIRKYTKMRPDGSKAVRYEVLDYTGQRASGQGADGFDDLKNAKQFYYRNRINLVAPVDESTNDNSNNDTQIEPIGMKESSRSWCKIEKRWKDNK